MKHLFAALSSLLLVLPLFGQSVKLPAEVKVQPGRLASITVEWDGDDVKYAVPPELDAFREYDPDPKKVRIRLIGYAAGKHTLFAVACKGGKLSEFAQCVIIVGEPGPPTPPTPPDPKPPTPPGPVPIAGPGFRAMIVFESADVGKMPAKQAAILTAKAVHEYLNAKTTPTADGGKRGWYITDQNVSFAGESKVWQDAFSRPRSKLPWIMISNGVTGYEGPLPDDVAATLDLLKRYGG